MREIKFRAWDTEKEEILSWKELKTLSICFDGGLYGIIKSGRYIMLQYTGLKDKNGKEIYEGGTVQFESWVVEEKRKGFIERWNSKSCWGINIPKEYDPSEKLANIHKSCTLEIIGNIYENPELLKKEK